MNEIKTSAVIGGGVIGTGWAARFLANGLDVRAWDPAAGAEARMRHKIGQVWPTLQRLNVAPGASPERLTFCATVEEAVGTADFVQESAPERIDLKTALHKQIDAAARPDVLIASSSSGLLPSEIQAEMQHPKRMLIGHPFNPVYLLPLVELVAGQKTAPESIDRARAFYAEQGMHPLHVRKEIDAYLSDRLQEAIWREYLHLVNDGIATTDELDQAMAFGPGLRWAFWGTGLIFHLAGGEQGMRHMLAQFGPALKLPWTKLEAPELTEDLIDKMATGTEAQAAGRSIAELEQIRDDSIIAVMQALRATGQGAGKTYAEMEAKAFARRAPKPWTAGDSIAAPLDFARSYVRPDWVDYNGHMSEGFYLVAIGDASDAFFRYIGIDEAYRKGGQGHSFYTVESHERFLKEVAGGQPLRFTTQILDLDEKRLHFFHAMYHGESGDLLYTAEQMLLHVDMAAGREAPIQPQVKAALDAIWAVHKDMPAPEGSGRQVGIKR